jgi:hypothetical protein
VTACISLFVVEAASAGDPEPAKQRIDVIRNLNVLDTNEEIQALADYLLLPVIRGLRRVRGYRLPGQVSPLK